MILSVLLCACGGPKPETVEVVASAQTEPEAEPVSPIDDLVERDAKKASEILTSALASDDVTVAAYAAVYLQFLGLKHDGAVAHGALESGATGDDLLASVLCWRRLAQHAEGELPGWNPDGAADPVVASFAYLAYARRGSIPKGLETALHAGNATAAKVFPVDLGAKLPAFFSVFDDGPVATAVAFVTARRRELADLSDKTKLPLSSSFRGDLLTWSSVTVPDGGFKKAREDYPGTKLLRLLDSPAWTHPMDMIRALCVRGTGTLQLEAVRALGARAVNPVAGDMAAAAAAMESEEPLVRVEAARTYLLLVGRATAE